MRPQATAGIAAAATIVLALTACGSAQVEETSAAEITSPEPTQYTIFIKVHDSVPLDFTINDGEGGCFPDALTVGANELGAQPPQVVIRDASDTVVGTAPLDSDGRWEDDTCILSADAGEVAASDFYTFTVEGDAGIFEIEQFSHEETLKTERLEEQTEGDTSRFFDIHM